MMRNDTRHGCGGGWGQAKNTMQAKTWELAEFFLAEVRYGDERGEMSVLWISTDHGSIPTIWTGSARSVECDPTELLIREPGQFGERNPPMSSSILVWGRGAGSRTSAAL